MVKIKRSQLNKQLQKTAGSFAGFDAPSKDYVYGGSESDTWGVDKEEKKGKSVIDKVKDAAKTGGRIAKDVGKDIAGRYQRTGAGLAEIVADVSGETAKQRKMLDDDIDNATEGLVQAGKKMKDTKLSPEERSRWQKVYEFNKQRVEESVGRSTERNEEIMSRTDPVRGGADIAGIGLDVLSGGTYGTLAAGAKTGQVLRAGNIGRNARNVNTARVAGEGATSAGLLEAGAATAGQVGEGDGLEIDQILKQATLGGVLGGLSGGLAGRATNKAITKAEEAATKKTKALFGEVDENIGSLDDELKRVEEEFMTGMQKGRANTDARDAFGVANDTGIEVTNASRALPSGVDTMKSELDKLDAELDAFRMGKATIPGRTNPEDLSAMGGMPAANVKTRADGTIDRRSKGGKNAGVFANDVEAPLANEKDQADNLRRMLIRRTALQQRIDELENPVQGNNVGEIMSSMADERSAPRNIDDIPEAEIVDTAEAARVAKANVEIPKGSVGKVAPSGDAGADPLAAPPVKTRTFDVPKTAKEIAKENKTPGFISELFTSTRGKLSQYGDAGKQVSDKLVKMRDTSEVAQAAFIKQIPSVLKLKGKKFEEFVDALDQLARGKNPDLSPEINRAVGEWKRMIPAVRQAAVKAGVEVGDLGEFYFPRNYSEILGTNKGMTKAINHLVKTKQASNIVEARNMLEHLKTRYATPFGHFDNSRKLDLPDYDKGRGALVSYVAGAFNKVAHAEEFGARGETAAELFETIGKGYGEKAKLRALDNYMIATGAKDWGRSDRFVKGSNAIRSFNRLRALGLSSLMNAGQTTNTASIAGLWNTAKAAMKVLTKQEREYVMDTGVILESAMNNLRDQSGVGNKLMAMFTAPGFTQVENFNRSVAAEAGRSYAKKLAKKAANGDTKAEQALRDKLGVTGTINGKLTRAQEIQASRKFVDTTQFHVDAQDLPGWASSPEGKMIAQFRTFIYKQNGFMYNQIVKEFVVNKNPAPLVRFLSVGIPIGFTTGYVREKIKGVGQNDVEGTSDNEKTLSQKTIAALQNVGGFGSFSDAGFLYSNAKSQRWPQYLAGTVGGPTAGFALETASNMQQAFASNPLDEEGNPKSFPERAPALTRQGLRAVPFVGNQAAKKVAPFKADVTEGQREVLEQAPDTVRQDIYKFFGDMKKDENSKTKAAVKVRKAVDSQNYNRGQRLAEEHNAKVEQQIADLQSRVGELPPDVLEYMESNYKISYEYYIRQDRRNRE